MRRVLLTVLASFVGWSFQAVAAPPAVNRITPAAVPPGQEISVQLIGENLDGPARLWTSFPCGGILDRETRSNAFKIKIPPQTPPGIGAVRLVSTNGMSALQLFLMDPVGSIPASGTNESMAGAQTLSRRIAVDGHCEELRSAFYRFTAKKGERIHLEAVAQRIGSPLDPFLRVLDTEGRELTTTDDTPGLGADARLNFVAPKKGVYLVELRDTRYGGGPRHRYRLRFAEPLPNPLPFHGNPELARFTAPLAPLPAGIEREPNDSPSAAQVVSLPINLSGRFAKPGDRDTFEFPATNGQRLLFTGRTRSLGSPCDLFFEIQNTNGTKVAEANVTGADEGVLTNRFAEGGIYRVVVEELNRQGGSDFSYQLAIQSLEAGFSLSTSTERVSAPAGDAFEVEVQAERRDYDGPIQLASVGLPEGFSVTNAVIAAKTNSTKLKISIPAELELGDLLEFGITGVAQINDTRFVARVSTLPALRATFPEMRHPPLDLDGLISLSISASKSATPQTRRKRRN